MKRLLSLLFLLVCCNVNAAIWFVSQSGSDAGSGAIGSPFATLVHALSVASAGDTINIRTGVYDENIEANQWKAGSAGSFVTIHNYNDETILFRLTGSHAFQFYGVAGRYIKIQGTPADRSKFTFLGDLKTGFTPMFKLTYSGGATVGETANHIYLEDLTIISNKYSHGILVGTGEAHVTNFVTRCDIIDNGKGYTPGNPGPPHGIYLSGSVGLTMTSNRIAGHKTSGSSGIQFFGYDYTSNNIIDSCLITNNLYGLIMADPDTHSGGGTNMLKNSVMAFNDYGAVIWYSSGSFRLLNDTWYKNTQYAIDMGHGTKGGAECIINNNLFDLNARGLIITADVGTAEGNAFNVYATNNAFLGSTILNFQNDIGSRLKQSGNLTGSYSAGMVDPDNGNYALAITSPARNAGASQTSLGVTTDNIGAARPQESFFDIGAFEYNAGGTTPTVTVTASIPNASETGPTAGKFNFSRGSDTSGGLTVNFVLTGSTATSVTDYATIGTSVTITNGLTSADVLVTPVDDATANEGNETVIVTLGAGSYTIGTPSVATVTISDNDSVLVGKKGF